MKDAAPLGFSAFQAALQTQFRIRLGGETCVDLTLAEAHAIGPETGDDDTRSFSLLFEGPHDPLLPQRMYRFEHDSMGAFELFIVPVARSEQHCRYEAVFNLAPPS